MPENARPLHQRKQTTELSPKSVPLHPEPSSIEDRLAGHSSQHADSYLSSKPQAYNPFSAVEDNSPQDLYYASPPYSANRMGDPKDIKFGNVDWTIQKPEPTRSRADSQLKEVKALKMSPTKQTAHKPPFYRPGDTPPSHSTSPPLNTNVSPGLGIQLNHHDWSPIYEKNPAGLTTPPLTYYTPYRSENFRTNLADEKHSWEPNHPPGSSYVPYESDLVDVELARPKDLPPGYSQAQMFARQRAPAVYPGAVATVSRNRECGWIWLLYALIIITPLAIALGVFGGVYHWNIHDERCSMTGGTWNQSTKTCQY